MSKLRIAATGLGMLSMLGVALAPIGASAQGMATNTYEVTITNLTTKQVLSPPIIATHASSAHAWQVGQPASEGVRIVAEEGMNDKLAAELKGVATDVSIGTGPLMPGTSVTLMIKAHEGDVLSAATMLVQTNDGFTGLDNMALSSAGDKETMAYDAGTEENDEKASNVPGPPFGGHNSGLATNPKQSISMHPGIMGKADIGSEFNWSGPVARFSVRMVGASETPGVSSNMPKTGAGDTNIWLLVLGAGTLLLSGLTARRFAFAKR